MYELAALITPPIQAWLCLLVMTGFPMAWVSLVALAVIDSEYFPMEFKMPEG